MFVSSQVFACKPTDGIKIELIGKVTPSVFKTETKLIHFKVLHLTKSTCFARDNVFSDEDQELQDLQLVLTKDLKVEVGKKYRFVGDAFHWHTAHHYTKVLFSAISATEL